MRIHEILTENASSGTTSSGNVAVVVQPSGGTGKRDQFFGGDPSASIYSAVIRRPSPTAEAGKKKKGNEKKSSD